MKFGRTLTEYMVPEWTDQYISYKSLKHIIKKVALIRYKLYCTRDHNPESNIENKSDPKAQFLHLPASIDELEKEEDISEQKFFDTVNADLIKVSKFYCKQRDVLEKRLKVWGDKIYSKRDSNNITDIHISNEFIETNDLDDKQLLLDSLNEIKIQLLLVLRYVEMNKSGFQKILKKFDKKCNLATNGVYVIPSSPTNSKENISNIDSLEQPTFDNKVFDRERNMTKGKDFFDNVVIKASFFTENKLDLLLQQYYGLFNAIRPTNDINNNIGENANNESLEINRGNSLSIYIPIDKTSSTSGQSSTGGIASSGLDMDRTYRSSIPSDLPAQLDGALNLDDVEELIEVLDIHERSLNEYTDELLASLKSHYKEDVTGNLSQEDSLSINESRRQSIIRQQERGRFLLLSKTVFRSTQKCSFKCIKYILDKYPELILQDNPYSSDNRTIVHKLVLTIANLKRNIDNGKIDTSASKTLNTKYHLRLSSTSLTPVGNLAGSSLDALHEKLELNLKFLEYILKECVTDDNARKVVYNKDVNGRTPVHYTSLYNLPLTANILLEYIEFAEANVAYGPLDDEKWLDDDGRSPMFYSLIKGYDEVLSIFVKGKYSKLLDSFNNVYSDKHILSQDKPIFSEPDERLDLGDSKANKRKHSRMGSVSQMITENIIASTNSPQLTSSSIGPKTMKTPLHVAAGFGYSNIIKLLLENGANPNIVDGDSETPLHISAKLGFLDCVNELLNFKVNGKIVCDVNIREKSFLWTPLFYAVCENHYACAKSLLRAGADPTLFDAMEMNVHDHSVFRAHNKMSKLLKLLVNDDDSNSKVAKVSKEGQATFIERAYGHEFLQDESMVRIYLGSLDARQKCIPIKIDENHIPISANPGTYKLIINCTNARCSKSILHLPITETLLDPFVFYCDNVDNVLVTFDIITGYSEDSYTDPYKLIARSTVPLSSAKTSLWREEVSSGGNISAPFISKSSFTVVGSVSFDFIVAKPFKHSLNVRSKNKWTQETNLPKLVGHRGSGMNGNNGKNGKARQLQLGENTLLSFITAGSLGAEYVEFDVQLTKDKVPVIYHDFRVWETGYNLPVSSITKEEFLALRPDDRPSRDLISTTQYKKQLRRTRSLGSHRSIMTEQLDSSSGDDTSSNQEKINNIILTREEQSVQLPFTTLEEAMKKVPQRVGFNIEVKYPQKDESEMEGLRPAEINEFVDKILEVVFENLGNRRVYFSSFHADVCWLLSLKQGVHAVFFLTDAGYGDGNEGNKSKGDIDIDLYEEDKDEQNEIETMTTCDARSWSLLRAVRFARRAGCAGIVCAATPVLEAPRAAKAVREAGLLLGTYGAQNSQKIEVEKQRKAGVDLVIADKIRAVKDVFNP